jgi:hypothetical protein
VFEVKCWAKILTVNGAQVTGGSKLNPRSVECCFLGYAAGRENYKLQDSASGRAFVSRDMVFEEGQPRHTSPTVEENIPLFDTLFDTLNEKNPVNDNDMTNASADPNSEFPINPFSIHGNANPDPEDHIAPDIPTNVECVESCWSTRISQPSSTSLQSNEYK